MYYLTHSLFATTVFITQVLQGNLKWNFTNDPSDRTPWAVYTSPVIAQSGVVYVSCTGNVYAISPQGKLLWKQQLGYTLGSVVLSSNEDAVFVASEPAGLIWAIAT